MDSRTKAHRLIPTRRKKAKTDESPDNLKLTRTKAHNDDENHWGNEVAMT